MSLFKRNNPVVPLLEEAQERFLDEKQASPMSVVFAFLLKRAAKHLKTHLGSQHGLTLSHGQALNAVSACLGYADWNTTNAAIEGMTDTYDEVDEPLVAMEKRRPTITVPPARSLSNSLDFDTSSLVIGPAGCGKTCGLLFAAQGSRILNKNRPVLIIRGEEHSYYQPNWTNALAHVKNAVTLLTWNPIALAKPDDVLEVGLPPNFWKYDAHEQQTWRVRAASAMQVWLLHHAAFKPLVIVEEAHSVLKTEVIKFLQDIPKEATVIWTTQSLHDLVDMSTVSKRFQNLYLMRGSCRSSGTGLLKDILKENVEPVIHAVEQLATGDAIKIPMPAIKGHNTLKGT